MSCDWHIKCLDCDDSHYFVDANHMDLEMAAVVRHAPLIAALLPLAEDVNQCPCGCLVLRLGDERHTLDIHWFAKHAGHRLTPINEYGHLLEQCTTYVKCGCGSNRRCALAVGHAPPCDPDMTRPDAIGRSAL